MDFTDRSRYAEDYCSCLLTGELFMNVFFLFSVKNVLNRIYIYIYILSI
jgi:hypothetical protein